MTTAKILSMESIDEPGAKRLPRVVSGFAGATMKNSQGAKDERPRVVSGFAGATMKTQGERHG